MLTTLLIAFGVWKFAEAFDKWCAYEDEKPEQLPCDPAATLDRAVKGALEAYRQ